MKHYTVIEELGIAPRSDAELHTTLERFEKKWERKAAQRGE